MLSLALKAITSFSVVPLRLISVSAWWSPASVLPPGCGSSGPCCSLATRSRDGLPLITCRIPLPRRAATPEHWRDRRVRRQDLPRNETAASIIVEAVLSSVASLRTFMPLRFQRPSVSATATGVVAPLLAAPMVGRVEPLGFDFWPDIVCQLFVDGGLPREMLSTRRSGNRIRRPWSCWWPFRTWYLNPATESLSVFWSRSRWRYLPPTSLS